MQQQQPSEKRARSNSCRHHRRRFPALYLCTTTITRQFALECWTHCSPQCRRTAVTWPTPANLVAWRPTCRTLFVSSWYYFNNITIISTTRPPDDSCAHPSPPVKFLSLVSSFSLVLIFYIRVIALKPV